MSCEIGQFSKAQLSQRYMRRTSYQKANPDKEIDLSSSPQAKKTNFGFSRNSMLNKTQPLNLNSTDGFKATQANSSGKFTNTF
jgi:hypothetical protein